MGALVERDGPLAVLDALVAAAEAGTGCLVLLAGEAGAGKSSVVRLPGRAEALLRAGGVVEPAAVPVTADLALAGLPIRSCCPRTVGRRHRSGAQDARPPGAAESVELPEAPGDGRQGRDSGHGLRAAR
jgi:hypothetical protein